MLELAKYLFSRSEIVHKKTQHHPLPQQKLDYLDIAPFVVFEIWSNLLATILKTHEMSRFPAELWHKIAGDVWLPERRSTHRLFTNAST